MLRHGLISPHSEMREERDKLKKELLSKKEFKIEDLEDWLPIHTAKMMKHVLKRTLRVLHLISM